MDRGEDLNAKRLINYRPAFEAAIGLIAGIAVCAKLDASGKIVFCCCFAVLAALLLLLNFSRFACFMCFCVVGAIALLLATPKALVSGEYKLVGVITDISDHDGYSTLRLDDVYIGDKCYNADVQLRVSDKLAASVRKELDIGVRLAASAHTNSYPCQDDGFLKMMSGGVGAYASAKSLEFLDDGHIPIVKRLYEIRTAVVRKINVLFGNEYGGMISALLVGDRTGLQEERTELYSSTGTTHILSISGYHMSVIAMIVMFLIPKSRPILRAVLCSAILFLYCSITVYAPALVRSAIMCTSLVICTAAQRRPDSLNALSVAAILLLIANPFQLYSIGFQLSFAACLGMFLLGKNLTAFLKKIHIPAANSISATISATLATFPFVLKYFGQFPIYTLLGNLVTIPSISFVMVSSIVIVPIGFVFPVLANTLAIIPKSVLFCSEWLLGQIAKLPFSIIPLKNANYASCIFFLISLFCISPYVLRPFEKRLAAAAVAFILFTGAYIAGIIVA